MKTFEKISTFSLAAIFFGINVATASRSPVPWFDEIAYISPGINLFFGDGFISRAWPEWSRNDFWAVYVPLYPLLQCFWLKLVGFGITQVRSLNYLLAMSAVLFMASTARRLHWVEKPVWRLVLMVLLICGLETTLSYRSGRPDALAMFIASLMVACFALPGKIPRLVLIFLTAFICPWAHLPLVAYGILAAAIFCAVYGMSRFREFAAMIGGFVTGFLVFVGIYSYLGAWKGFADYNRNYVAFGQDLMEKFALPSLDLPAWGSFLLSVSVLLVLASSRKSLKEFEQKELGFSLALALSAPPVMYFLGEFHGMYLWMSYAPLAVCACRFFARHLAYTGPVASKFLCGLLAVTTMIGLPLQLGLIAREWEARDYKRVEDFVRSEIAPNDVVFSNFLAYYAAKQVSKKVFLVSYNRFSDERKKKISVLIIRPSRFEQYREYLGGEWYLWDRYTGEKAVMSGRIGQKGWIKGDPKYELGVYRRQPPPEYVLPK